MTKDEALAKVGELFTELDKEGFTIDFRIGVKQILVLEKNKPGEDGSKQTGEDSRKDTVVKSDKKESGK